MVNPTLPSTRKLHLFAVPPGSESCGSLPSYDGDFREFTTSSRQLDTRASSKDEQALQTRADQSTLCIRRSTRSRRRRKWRRSAELCQYGSIIRRRRRRRAPARVRARGRTLGDINHRTTPPSILHHRRAPGRRQSARQRLGSPEAARRRFLTERSSTSERRGGWLTSAAGAVLT